MAGKTEVIKTKYLPIGNSASGIGAAETICDVDRNGALIIAHDKAYFPYSCPLTSRCLATERTIDMMSFRSSDCYSQKALIASLNISQDIYPPFRNHIKRLLQWEQELMRAL
jgi:hypothetical protein